MRLESIIKKIIFEADYYFEKHQDRIGSTSPRCRAIVIRICPYEKVGSIKVCKVRICTVG